MNQRRCRRTKTHAETHLYHKLLPIPRAHSWNQCSLTSSQTTCTALHTTAKWAIPQLLQLVAADPDAKPSLLVTTSLLPQDPIPELFVLSMVKAAQKNMVQSLAKTYGPQGVHVGLVVVGGAVSPTNETLNPSNIAGRTWELFDQDKGRQTLEVEIL